jgi:hypothetical protein
MNVGVMKDYKLRDLRVSHTLGDVERCCLFGTGIKKYETEGYKCHAETMMSTKS